MINIKQICINEFNNESNIKFKNKSKNESKFKSNSKIEQLKQLFVKNNVKLLTSNSNNYVFIDAYLQFKQNLYKKCIRLIKQIHHNKLITAKINLKNINEIDINDINEIDNKLSFQEACSYLQISHNTLEKMIRRNEIIPIFIRKKDTLI